MSLRSQKQSNHGRSGLPVPEHDLLLCRGGWIGTPTGCIEATVLVSTSSIAKYNQLTLRGALKSPCTSISATEASMTSQDRPPTSRSGAFASPRARCRANSSKAAGRQRSGIAANPDGVFGHRQRAYLRNESVLVDTGFASAQVDDWAAFADFETPADILAKVELEPKDVKTILLTHLHFDHVGNIDAFQGRDDSAATIRIRTLEARTQDPWPISRTTSETGSSRP